MTANACGVFLEPVIVRIPTAKDCRLLIYIARDNVHYYGGYAYDWQTGGMGVHPGNNGLRYGSRVDVFLGMLKRLESREDMKRQLHSLSEARHDLFDAIHKQLTLF